MAIDQETNKGDLQRTLASAQNEKISMDRKMTDAESEVNNLRAKLKFEATRYKELESVVQAERRSAHEADHKVQ